MQERPYVNLICSNIQTFLEQMKGVFSKTPVKALDRIPPTVGLNGRIYFPILSIVATIEIEDVRVVIWDVGGHVINQLIVLMG